MKLILSATILLVLLAYSVDAEDFRLLRFDSGSRCVAVSSATGGSQLFIETCNSNSDYQLWKLDGDKLKVKAGPGYCVRRTGGEGSRVALIGCSNGGRQLWEINPSGNDHIRSKSNTELCWETYGTGSGSQIYVDSCSSSDSRQRFGFDDAGSTTDFKQYRNVDGRCFGVGSNEIGAPIRLFECDNHSQRNWKLNSNQQLVLQANTALCLQRMGNGAVAQTQPCTSTETNQRWIYNEYGREEFETPATNQCLEYDSESELGSAIRTYGCGGSAPQLWYRCEPSDSLCIFQEERSVFGCYNIQLKEDDAKCVGVDDTFSDEELKVVACTNDENTQIWCLDDDKKLKLDYDIPFCATRSNSFSSSENLITIKPCTSYSYRKQEWDYHLDYNHQYQFLSLTLGDAELCMEYSSTTSGAPVYSHTCDDKSTNQQFLYSTVQPLPPPEKDGYEVFLNSGFPEGDADCRRCIGVDVLQAGSTLIWTDCSSTQTLRYEDYPTDEGNLWCTFDDDAEDYLCVIPIGDTLQLAYESTYSQPNRLVWYHEDNKIKNEALGAPLCLGVTGNNIKMIGCGIGDPKQEWAIESYSDQEKICDELITTDTAGKNPSATTPGNLIYLKSEYDCEKCIAITGCSNANYNCPNAHLVATDCVIAPDDQYLKFWDLTPGDNSMWCSRDSNWCIDYGGSSGLQLVLQPTQAISPRSSNQYSNWDFIPSSGLISPSSSSGHKCVATLYSSSDTMPFLGNCANVNDLSQWSITSYDDWARSCAPIERDAAPQGVFIHADTDTDCGWCIGVDTSANPYEIGLAPCVDDNDEYETNWRTENVPSEEKSIWCLHKYPRICISYSYPTTSTGLSVITATGHQDELWYHNAVTNEINPRVTPLMCITRSSPELSRVVSMERCQSVTREFKSWNIVNINAYACNAI